MREITIGLLGIGTVGTGVLKLLAENQERIEDRLGARVTVRRVACRDLDKPRAGEVDASLLTDHAEDVLEDPEIDVVLELVGGVEPVRSYLLKAIANGKHIVTANKALLAHHGEELLAAAAERHVDLAFEASVGGGIPVIRALRESLASDHVEAIYGIINGTTNYILTRMSAGAGEFETVLAEASAKGYAEADPSLDVDGHDAAQKLAILAAIAFNARVTPGDIYTEGIRSLTAFDVATAAEMGYVVKLLAVAQERGGALDVRVHPAMVAKGNLLSQVSGVYNAVLMRSRASGDQLFYGRGAGMMPTASAVVSDVIEVCRDVIQQRHGRIPGFGHRRDRAQPLRLLPMSETQSRYFLRFSAVDQPGVLGKIATVLGENSVSIAEMRQSDSQSGGGVPVVMLTHMASEGDVRRALDGIDQLEITTSATHLLRVVEPEATE